MSAPTLTTYAVGKILDAVFGGSALGAPATWYLKLTAGGVEISGNGYARVAVTNNSANWPATVSRLKQLATLAQFVAATGPWANVDGFAIADAAAAGNDWVAGDLQGLPVTCLADVATATLGATAHGFTAGQVVRVEAMQSQSLPTGLAAATSYFVVNPTANAFQLSATQGGAAINLTTAGVLIVSPWYGKTGISTTDVVQFPANTVSIRIPTATLG